MKQYVKLTLLLFVLSLPVESAWGQCAELYKEGETLMKAGYYEDAIKSFKAAMACDGKLKSKCEDKIAKCKRKIPGDKPKPGGGGKGIILPQPDLIGIIGLNLDPHRLVFGSAGSTGTIKVNSRPEEWNVKPDANAKWCTIQKLNNFTLSVTCDKNPGTTERQAILIVSNKEKKETVTVIQEGQKEYIRIPLDKVEFNPKGEIKEVPVESNLKWDVIAIPDWCKIVSQTHNTLFLKAEKKDQSFLEKVKLKYKSREGILTIQAENKEAVSIILVQ